MAIEAGDAVWKIKGDLGSLEKDLNEGTRKVEAATKEIEKRQTDAGRAMTIAGGAIVGAYALAGKSAMSYGAALGEVATLQVKQLDVIDKGIKDVARTYGTDLVESAKGAYQAISATGFDGADAVMVLEKSTMAATAGVASVSEAVELGTGTMNAFGKGVGDLEGIFDETFIAVKSGVTTFGELSASVGKLSPIMAGVGSSSKEMFAALAAVTKGGMGTAEAVTGLKAAYTNIIKPTDDALKTAEALGIEFSTQALKAKGLKGFLDDLAKATGGNIDTMSKLFGSVEGLNVILALTGNQAGSFASILDEMENSAGATKLAFETLAAVDPSLVWRQLKADVEVLSVELGESFLPILNRVVEYGIIPTIKAVIWLAETFPTLTSGVTIAGGAIGTFLITAGPILWFLPGVTKGVKDLAYGVSIATPHVVAFTAACAPWVVGIGAVTLAIGALALTIKEAMEYNEQWVAARAAENEALEAEAKLRTQLTDMGYKSANDVVIARLEERLKILQDAGQKSLEMSGKVSQEMLDQELTLTESLKGAYQRRGGEIPPIHQKLYDSVRHLAEQGGIEQIVVAEKTGEAMVDANSETAKELERIAEDQAEVRGKYNLEQEQELMKAAEKSTEFLEQIAAGYHKWKIVVGTKLTEVIDILRAFNVSYKAQWAIAVEATDNAATEIESRFAILEGNIAGRAAMLAKSIGEMLDSVSGSAASASGGAAVESGNQGASINMNVNLSGMTVSSEMDMASLGKKLGASIASKLQTAGVML